MADRVNSFRLPYRLVTFGVIGCAFALNLIYIALLCPHDLAPDEAHYWDWSRHLDWCYYSKGPLVAWLIRGGCLLFGDTPFGVRFPAAVCSALLLMALERLVARTGGSPKMGLAVVLVALTMPPFVAVSVIMTIDAPLLCCWAWAAVFLHRALFDGGIRNWLAAGILVALGSLAKYTMLFVPFSVCLLLLARPEYRRHLRCYGFWLFLLVSVLGQLPILIWNANHDWLGARHLQRLSGAGDESGFRLLGPFVYIATQAGMMLGIWFAAWAASITTQRNTSNPHTAFLWWFSVPVWLVCVVASFSTAVQPNWPAPAYITGLILAVAWITANWQYRILKATVAITMCGGLLLIVPFAFPGIIRPTLARFATAATPLEPAPVRKLDPTARLAGWRTLAAEVDRQCAAVRENGEEPLIAGMTWTLPGELGFYCQGHPTVYSFGSALADRTSQYEIWRPNPVQDAQAFRGRTFVYVGAALPAATFDRTETVTRVEHREGNIVLAVWEVRICRGFRGFEHAVRKNPPRY